MNITIEEIKPDIYRMVIMDQSRPVSVCERQDYRGEMVAKTALFGIGCRRYTKQLGKELDRFLFL